MHKVVSETFLGVEGRGRNKTAAKADAMATIARAARTGFVDPGIIFLADGTVFLVLTGFMEGWYVIRRTDGSGSGCQCVETYDEVALKACAHALQYGTVIGVSSIPEVIQASAAMEHVEYLRRRAEIFGEAA